MESIIITMPKEMSVSWVKNCFEGNLKKNSKYSCHVTYTGIETGEHTFKITTNCAQAFYLIGMTASQMIAKFNEKISHS